MAKQLKAVKCPSDELSLTNCAIVHPNEYDNVRYAINKFQRYFSKKNILNFLFIDMSRFLVKVIPTYLHCGPTNSFLWEKLHSALFR